MSPRRKRQPRPRVCHSCGREIAADLASDSYRDAYGYTTHRHMPGQCIRYVHHETVTIAPEDVPSGVVAMIDDEDAEQAARRMGR